MPSRACACGAHLSYGELHQMLIEYLMQLTTHSLHDAAERVTGPQVNFATLPCTARSHLYGEAARRIALRFFQKRYDELVKGIAAFDMRAVGAVLEDLYAATWRTAGLVGMRDWKQAIPGSPYRK
jgi:hypothetical protein